MGVPLVLTGSDVASHLRPSDAVDWTVEALQRRAAGELSSPPRLRAGLDGGRMVFTVGASGRDWYGYRSYDTFATPADEQVVVVSLTRERRGRGHRHGFGAG